MGFCTRSLYKRSPWQDLRKLSTNDLLLSRSLRKTSFPIKTSTAPQRELADVRQVTRGLRERSPRHHFLRDFLRKRKIQARLCCKDHQKKAHTYETTSHEHQALTVRPPRLATRLGENIKNPAKFQPHVEGLTPSRAGGTSARNDGNPEESPELKKRSRCVWM